MLEELIVRHCSPTLAGLKTGSLFTCACACLLMLRLQMIHLNNLLNPKGVNVVLLRLKGERALIYVYHPKKLAEELEREGPRDFLLCKGYLSCDAESCIKQLSDRLTKSEVFPHEIGLFLGYPLSDVKAFIDNRGENCKCIGCWKAYTDERQAKETFAKYKKCTGIYCKKYKEGISILRLTVVA